MYPHGRGSERACEEVGESKVLEMPGADCGLGNRRQRNMYRICKMYVHGECRYGVQTSLPGGGKVQGPGEKMDGARGSLVGP
jgi:hypothetical protein